ncbi:ABC transporter substrate-binding protein [Inquilinus limosus]|uniref:ABC transporter substrate-binding protein n=1 Tax=Inquilinus limosus TaxID=171674 RepID=UPI00041B31A1|nr:ABC transporter substrate-binding protein [Inquilinus limosus]
MRSPAFHRLVLTLALLLPLPFVTTAASAAEPRQVVETLDAALLDVMKNADSLGFRGRYQKLEPVLDRVFNLPLMARIAVGPDWSTLNASQQQKVTDAFRRFSITTYAARFDGYGGESFQAENAKPVSGGDQVVNTTLVRPSGAPVLLNYRLRAAGGNWQIIDVYLNGTISQLANYRSEFGATLRNGGGDALIKLIEGKIAELTPRR